MSYTVSAYVFRGIKIKRSEFILEEREPGCIHNTWQNFCPECGAPRIRADYVYVEGYDKVKEKWNGFDTVIGVEYVLIGKRMTPYVHDGHFEEIINEKVDFEPIKDYFRVADISNWLLVAGN